MFRKHIQHKLGEYEVTRLTSETPLRQAQKYKFNVARTRCTMIKEEIYHSETQSSQKICLQWSKIGACIFSWQMAQRSPAASTYNSSITWESIVETLNVCIAQKDLIYGVLHLIRSIKSTGVDANEGNDYLFCLRKHNCTFQQMLRSVRTQSTYHN